MPSLKSRLAKLLMYPVPRPPGGRPESAPQGGGKGGGTDNAPVFANYKAVTFPALVVLISGAWLGLRQLEVPWLADRWVPFVLCMLLGGGLTWLEVTEDQVTPPKRKAFGVLVGLCNCLVLFSAVVGAANVIGAKPPPTAQTGSPTTGP
ncbi:MAG: hypothetical protein K2X82_14150 [Gemmataceae bacterium]|nr:hypothetical protein [Gemmataceae bacterium]